MCQWSLQDQTTQGRKRLPREEFLDRGQSYVFDLRFLHLAISLHARRGFRHLSTVTERIKIGLLTL